MSASESNGDPAPQATEKVSEVEQETRPEELAQEEKDDVKFSSAATTDAAIEQPQQNGVAEEDEDTNTRRLMHPVSFVSHPDHENYDFDADRIVSVRLEVVDPSDVPSLVFLHSEDDDDDQQGKPQNFNVEDLPPTTVVCIDRSARKSKELLSHIYTPTVDVYHYLLAQTDVPILVEDAQLISFAISFSDPKGLAQRSFFHKKVVPMQKENQLLRDALKIPKQSPVTKEVIAGVMANLDRGSHGPPHHSRPQQASSSSTAQQQQQPRIATPSTRPASSNVIGRHGRIGGAPPQEVKDGEMQPPAPDSQQLQATSSSQPSQRPDSHHHHHTNHALPPRAQTAMAGVGGGGGTGGCLHLHTDEQQQPLHSPLAWDEETDAAINARTPYSAYNLRKRFNERGRLDKITQSHLVTRLHDKCMDQRSRRRAEIEDKIQRELGIRERRTLSPDAQHELGIRLHDQQHKHSAKVKEGLQTKYLGDLRGEKKKLSVEQQKASANRMHDETMAKAKSNMEKLVDTLILSKDPKKVKLANEQQQAMADRLSKRQR